MTHNNHPLQQIVRNAIQCPDGTILDSKHRHDYQAHIDAVTKEHYTTDGGLDYVRRSINKAPYKDLTLTTADSIDQIRKYFSWSSVTKQGRVSRCLAELSDQHISNILLTQQHIKDTFVEQLLIREQEYRKTNNITVKEYQQ